MCMLASRWVVTHFHQNLSHVLVVLNLSILGIIGICNSRMTSSWAPQCHHDIIMRTPRITGKPRLSCSRGLKTPQMKIPFFELGIKKHPKISGPSFIRVYNTP